MTTKEKKQFWIIPLFFTFYVAAYYLFFYKTNGYILSDSHFDLLSNVEREHLGALEFSKLIKLPFSISRWFDILFTWIGAAYLVRMFIFSFNNLKIQDLESEKADKKDKKEFFKIGIAAGVMCGVLVSFIAKYINYNASLLMTGIGPIFFSGLAVGVFTGFLFRNVGKHAGIGISTTYGISVFFLFGILNLHDISIFIVLILGLITNLITFIATYIGALIGYLFSRAERKNKDIINRKKNSLKESLKKMILNISAEKGLFIIWSLITTIVISLLFITFILILKRDDPMPMLTISLAGVWTGFIIFIAIIYSIIRIKISSFKIKKDRIILIHKEKGKGLIYTKPLWGKYSHTLINFSDNWSGAIKEGGFKYFKFPFEVIINRQLINGRGTKTIITFPITINFYFGGPLSISDLEKISSDESGKILEKKVINIDDYISNYFSKINFDENILKKIEDAAIMWVEGKYSSVHLSRIAAYNLKFPKDIFSNIEKLEFRVELPKSQIMEIFESDSTNKD